MGMVGNYLRVSADELKDYINDSSKLEDRFYSESNHLDENYVDVDKAWEGLFFLLTGKSVDTATEATAPLSWILNPTQEIDKEQDMGYGPAAYTTIEQTAELSKVLNDISVEELRKRYNGELMMEENVYPEIWDEEDAVEYLMEFYITLKEFYSKAAAANQAVIFFIN